MEAMVNRLFFRFQGLPVLLEEEEGFLSFLGFAEAEGREATPLLSRWKAEVEEYLSGLRKSFDLPYRLPGSAFAQRVYTATLDVPYGQTASYASLLGRNFARPVGTALARNPLALVIPCHRIVGANDPYLYRYGPEIKKRLLDLERNHR